MSKNVSFSMKGKAGRITISGVITSEKNTAREISDALDELEKECKSITMLLMNCYGGSVFEGLGIRSRMKRSAIPIATEAEGLVASMGTILYAAGSTRSMARASRLLFHRPSGKAEGDFDQMKDAAASLESLEKELIACYVEDLGMDEAKVKATFLKPGRDLILDAVQAKEYNLVAEANIFEGVIKTPCPMDVIMKSDPQAVAAFYEAQITELNSTKNMKNLALFVAALAITGDDVTEEKVLAAIQKMAGEHKALTEENDNLKLVAAASQKQAITSMIDAAVKAGKIMETQRGTFEGLAKADFENTKKALEQITPHSSVIAQIDLKKKVGEIDKFKDYTFKDYQQKAPKELAKMQKESPDEFKALKQSYLDSLK